MKFKQRIISLFSPLGLVFYRIAVILDADDDTDTRPYRWRFGVQCSQYFAASCEDGEWVITHLLTGYRAKAARTLDGAIGWAINAEKNADFSHGEVGHYFHDVYQQFKAPCLD